MACWFFPINDSLFRLDDAIQAGNGEVDIRSSEAFSAGDIIYVYKARPEDILKYKMEVIQVGVPQDEVTDRPEFWADLGTYYDGLLSSRYCRLHLVQKLENGDLTGEKLRAYGLHNLISVDVMPPDVLSFIQNPTLDDAFGVDYPEENDFYEGALMTVEVNKYERSRAARDECIEKKGCRCVVCEMNFEEKYGPEGKGFIHVHHLVPISSIGKDYKLDVERDLVPVCPNCHYMLHRKPGGVYTPEELKEMIRK